MADEIEGTEEQTEEWSGPTREEWESTQETMEFIRDAISQPYVPEQTTQEQEAPQVSLDPFADDFGQNLTSLIQNTIQENVAPYSQFTEEQILTEAEERAMDIIHDLGKEKGDLPEGGAQLVRALANDYIADAQTQYGFGPQAAEAALSAAYDEAQGIFNASAKAYHDQQMEELGTITKARQEPESTTPAAQGTQRVKGDEMSLVRNIFGR